MNYIRTREDGASSGPSSRVHKFAATNVIEFGSGREVSVMVT